MSEQLTLTALIRVRPDAEAAFVEAALQVIPPTRAEEGCLEYRLQRHDDRPGTFSFFEIWRTDADLDAHMRTAHIERFIAAIEPLLEGEILLERWREVND